jgi:hypothetical protein
MSSLRLAAAGAAAALALSVFAAGTADAQLVRHNKDGYIHFMLTPEYAKQIGRVPKLSKQADGEMLYYGGTVFSNVKVVSVIWGRGVDPQTIHFMPGFLKAMPNSTYLDQLIQYSTVGLTGVNGHKGSDQTIARGTFLGQFKIRPHNKNTTLQDKDLRVELKYQIRHGHLPPHDLDTLYMIYFPDNIIIQAFGLQSCQAFGAYHFAHLKHGPDRFFYGVMPGCHYSFASHTIVSSHEFSEALSDNNPTPGSNPDFPQAWNNATGFEIGDLCQGRNGTLTTSRKTYTVQQEYLNSIAGCSTGNYTSP